MAFDNNKLVHDRLVFSLRNWKAVKAINKVACFLTSSQFEPIFNDERIEDQTIIFIYNRNRLHDNSFIRCGLS